MDKVKMNRVARLENKRDGHYKFYSLGIGCIEDSYYVSFMYGRIGSKRPTSGIKLNRVSKDHAYNYFNKTVTAKLAKGYIKSAVYSHLEALKGIIEESTKYEAITETPPPSEEKSTVEPAEASAKTTTPPAPAPKKESYTYPPVKAIGRTEVIELIQKDQYCCYEGHHGKKIFVIFSRGYVKIYDEKGERLTSLPPQLERLLVSLSKESGVKKYAIEAHWCGEDLYVYDILQWEGEDISWKGYATRLDLLEKVASTIKDSHIHRVEAAYTLYQKKALTQSLLESRKDGIVFRHIESPYQQEISTTFIYTIK